MDQLQVYFSFTSQKLKRATNKTDKAKYFYECNTTVSFPFRPPEMLDDFSEFDITTKVDIWMLGCMTYFIVYKEKPFPDGEKLAITNCAYEMPIAENVSEKFLDLVRHMLTPNPSERPSALDILDFLSNWEETDVKLSVKL